MRESASSKLEMIRPAPGSSGKKSPSSSSLSKMAALLSASKNEDGFAYPAVDYEDYGGGGVGGNAGVGVGVGVGGNSFTERSSRIHKDEYGLSGYGGSSGYGTHSGYGGGGGHGGYDKPKECCELVVDPLTFATLMAAIIGGTAFLNVVVTMVLGRKRRRRRSDGGGGGAISESILDTFHAGRRG